MAKRKAISVSDLPNQTGIPGPHTMLHCDLCGADWSANKGDYFTALPGRAFYYCGLLMRLVTKQTVYRDA